MQRLGNCWLPAAWHWARVSCIRNPRLTLRRRPLPLPTATTIAPPDYSGFAALLGRLQRYSPGDTLLQPPVIYRDSSHATSSQPGQFEVRLAGKPLGLQHRVVKLAGRGFPVCYSVVYKNCLVALFKSGGLVATSCLV